jgi:hypothetical protein
MGFVSEFRNGWRPSANDAPREARCLHDAIQGSMWACAVTAMARTPRVSTVVAEWTPFMRLQNPPQHEQPFRRLSTTPQMPVRRRKIEGPMIGGIVRCIDFSRLRAGQ